MPSVIDTFPRQVELQESLFIPLSDGTRLAARMWLPVDASNDPVPVLLEYLPYRKRDGTRWRDAGLHHYIAGHGYACIRVDIRGTGDSDGLIADEYTVQEQLDGLEIIDWLSRQPWSTGRVAMIGISWGGFNGLQIAARKPPALATIITVGSTDDRYATDVHWVGGCLSKDNFDWSSTMFAINDMPPDPALVGPGWRAMWQERLEANRPWIFTWMAHQRRDDYWKQGSVCEDFSAIDIPVYAVSGWADNYSEAVPRLLAGLKGPRLGLIGPWAHSYPHNVAVEPGIDWLAECVRWLDHWMKGIDTGIMDLPMLRAWMQDSVRPKTCYTDRPGRWVGEAIWPSDTIRQTRFHPDSGARLQTGGPGSGHATICSPLWVGLAAGEVGRYGNEAEWAVDQREDDGGSLVFVTEPLAEPLEILGAPQLELAFSSDKPQALVAVRLNDVHPDGASTRVTVGLLNLTHRLSHEHPEPLVPGKADRAVVDLDDIAHHFPAGHRIAVSISTTYWPIAWPSPELATLTIDLASTSLVLPVRPVESPDEALVPFGPAVAAPPAEIIDHERDKPTRRIVHCDLLTGTMTVDFPRSIYDMEMPDIGRRIRSEGYSRYIIRDNEPLSARIETHYHVDLIRDDATITHVSTGAMWCDAHQFHMEQTLEARENGQVVFTRQFRESVDRDNV